MVKNMHRNSMLVNEIALDVVAEIAPQELPIFRATSSSYFADPVGAMKSLQPQDNPLGFGIESTAILLTPVVLHILSEVFQILTEIAKKAVEAGLAKEIPELIKKMFKKYNQSEPPVLTREQIGLVHARVLIAAKTLRLPQDKAHSLANAVITQLTLPNR